MNTEFHHTVEIGKGLGEIEFGFSTDDVQRRLGKPDEAETLDPGTESTVMWFYVNKRLQIIFQTLATNEIKCVTQLTSSHPAATLWGERIIGCPENEILALFKAHNYEGFTVASETVGEQRYKSLRQESSRISLDFRDGVLQHILWGRVKSQPPGYGQKL